MGHTKMKQKSCLYLLTITVKVAGTSESLNELGKSDGSKSISSTLVGFDDSIHFDRLNGNDQHNESSFQTIKWRLV